MIYPPDSGILSSLCLRVETADNSWNCSSFCSRKSICKRVGLECLIGAPVDNHDVFFFHCVLSYGLWCFANGTGICIIGWGCVSLFGVTQPTQWIQTMSQCITGYEVPFSSFLGFYHGFTMVLPWFYHGFTMVLLWFYYGFTMVLLWFYYGFTMVLPWFYHGFTMVLPWFYYGFTMVLLWFYYGFTVVLLWFYYGFTMVLPWFYHDDHLTDPRPRFCASLPTFAPSCSSSWKPQRPLCMATPLRSARSAKALKLLKGLDWFKTFREMLEEYFWI